jgi:hypothetical protein
MCLTPSGTKVDPELKVFPAGSRNPRHTPKLDISETMWPTVFLVLGDVLLDWATAEEIDP